MPHYGVLGNHKFEDEDIEDVRGAVVYGVNDEKLGTIDDVIFSHASGQIRYAVVDAGGWFSSKKFLLPAGYIQPYGRHEDKFYADLDQERIRFLPEFKGEVLRSEGEWAGYEKQYEERWNEGSNLYNQDTNRIITPPMDQVEGGRSTPLSEAGKRSLERDFTPRKMGREDEYLGVASSRDPLTLHPQRASMGGREDARLPEPDVSRVELDAERGPAEDPPSIQEPALYRVDAMPEEEHGRNPDQPLDAGYGRRWVGLQQKLREGRDRIVSECPLCGTQKKVA